MSAVPYSRHYEEIARIAATAQGMVRDVMDAFVNWDVKRAERVMLSDDEVDEAYHVLFRSLLETMIRDPSTIEACAHMQSLAKYLERIGDHATNLAEHVVFMVDAKDVRQPRQAWGAIDLSSPSSCPRWHPHVDWCGTWTKTANADENMQRRTLLLRQAILLLGVLAAVLLPGSAHPNC